MADPIPPARALAPDSPPDYLRAAALAIVLIGVPIAFRVVVPANTTWIAWAFHLLPLLVVAAAILDARRRGESPWRIVRDPARRVDARRWIYAGFDVAFAAGYLYAFEYLIPNRHAWATMALEALPLATWTMAIGTLLARRWTWWLVIAGGGAMLVWTGVVLFVLLYTVSYLAGVYGAFGKAASSGALGSMALVIQFVALLPAFQLKWAMTRAGRRAFGRAAA